MKPGHTPVPFSNYHSRFGSQSLRKTFLPREKIELAEDKTVSSLPSSQPLPTSTTTPIATGKRMPPSTSISAQYLDIKAVHPDPGTGSDAEIDTEVDTTSTESDGDDYNEDTQGQFPTENIRTTRMEMARDNITPRRVKLKKRESKLRALTESRVRRAENGAPPTRFSMQKREMGNSTEKEAISIDTTGAMAEIKTSGKYVPLATPISEYKEYP